jgi:hypothetical protein
MAHLEQADAALARLVVGRAFAAPAADLAAIMWDIFEPAQTAWKAALAAADAAEVPSPALRQRLAR